MKLIAGMLARNEQHVLGLSARAALMWCDELVIFNHASQDDTDKIAHNVAQEHPGRVTILCEQDPVWREMSYRQRMLEAARISGATHYTTVDADEVLTANLLPSIRLLIADVPYGRVFQPPWVCLADLQHLYS